MKSEVAIIDFSGSKYAGSGSYSTSMSSSARSAIDSDSAGHVVTDIANLVDSKCGLIVPNRKNSIFVRRVVPGNDRDHTIESERTRCVNAIHHGVRIG